MELVGQDKQLLQPVEYSWLLIEQFHVEKAMIFIYTGKLLRVKLTIVELYEQHISSDSACLITFMNGNEVVLLACRISKLIWKTGEDW